VQIEEIHDFESFLQLQSAWDELCERSGTTSFFLSHAWFRCCWSTAPPDVRPFLLIVRDRGELVGIAPLMVQRTNWRVFPLRVVSLLQNQDTPFTDFVLAREHGDRGLSAILGHLRTMRGWHLLSLPKIECGSSTDSALQDHLRESRHLRLPASRSPVLAFDCDWRTFWNRQSQRFKKTVRNIVNRVERLGSVSVDELSRRSSAAECFDVFRAVAARSWKADLAVSVTRNAKIGAFFSALTTVLQASEQLRLWVLRVDGRPVATEYHIRDADTTYALRSDFDERLRDASPGAYLNYQIIRTYFERAVRVYDMGPGDSEYKQRWATSQREFDSFWIFNRTPYPTAVYNVERRAVPLLRHARDWWRGDRLTPTTREGWSNG
jgi:CelD/BcsL family acetyltransferase involved in cellulose biosynthesis